MRKARMQAETRHRVPVRRRLTLRVQRAELGQQVARLRQGAGRWRIEEGEIAPVAGAPDRQLEGERRQVGGQDLRHRMGRARALIRFGPQADADPRTEPAGAAAPLVGGRLAGAHGFEARHAGARIVARHAREAGIDDDADVLDGQAGLRDGGGQHHLASTRRRRGHGRILLARREVAVERRHDDGRAEIGIGQMRGHAPDLAGARQECEDAAVLLREGASDRLRHAGFDVAGQGSREVACLDRMGAALARDDGRVAQQCRDGRGVERGRHHDEAQRRAERGARTPA